MVKPAPYIETSTGTKFYFLKPTEESIHIEDIAHALSNKCRFAGHTSNFYSVAEHSYIVSLLVPEPWELAALLHDSAETYLEDIPSPIKPYFKEYKKFETRIMKVIASKFKFEYPSDLCIKEADRIQLKTEGKYLMPSQGVDYPVVEGRNGKVPKCLAPVQAEKLFLERFYELIGEPPIKQSLIVL